MTDQLAVLEQVVLGGDLARLSPTDRMLYYREVCTSLGLNPLTRPLEYLHLSGKLVLYARKDATDQLRKKHGVSITKVENQVLEGLYIVTVYAKDNTGREDSEIGAVPIEGLKGEARANAVMKALTKGKRRVTLSLCGLGMLDESELDTMAGARPIDVDPMTGEIASAPNAPENGERTVMGETIPSGPDRDVLLGQMKGLADALGLKAPARATLLEKHNIRDPRTCDISALQDLLVDLRAMRK